MKSKILLSYAMDFSSYLIQKIKNKEKILKILLFGSVTREEADKDSDIDIFIDIKNDDKKFEITSNKILSEYQDSTKYKNYWQMLGINNKIKLSIGKLDKWKDLKSSMIANGIVLYGKYKSAIQEGNHYCFFFWENIKPNSKRVLFNKQLFGYKQNNKVYNGLLQKYDGKRFAKGCIKVPLEHSVVFHNHFKKYKIPVRINKVLEY